MKPDMTCQVEMFMVVELLAIAHAERWAGGAGDVSNCALLASRP